MGNYKSRPPHTCSEELLRRILQSYHCLQLKLQVDLTLSNVSTLSPIQKACCSKDVFALHQLVTTENVGERLENGLSLLHLCCISSEAWRSYCDIFPTSKSPSHFHYESSSSMLSPASSLMAINSSHAGCPDTTPSPPPYVLQLSSTKLKERSKLLKKASARIHAKLESKMAEELHHQNNELEWHKPDTSATDILDVNNEKKLNVTVNPLYIDEEKRVNSRQQLCCITSGKNKQFNDPIECVELLLDKGADTAIISKTGFSPLHLAAYQGNCEMVQLLLDHCPHLDHTAAGSLTALHLACMAGHLGVVQILAQRGANIEARDQASYAPLHVAALYNRVAVVEYLVSRGVDVNISSSVGTRALHLAAGGGHSEVVITLLQRGARVCLHDEEGHLPLHWCVGVGGQAVRRAAAISYTAASNYAGVTAGGSAAGAGVNAGGSPVGNSMEVLALLLHHHRRADVLTSNLYCDTPLHVACYHGRYECAKTLLTYGGPAQLLKENLWGETPLHAACTSGYSPDLVSFLLQQHHNYVNHQSWDGHTPLHSACYHGHTAIVQLLISHSADTNLLTTQRSPFLTKDDSGGQTAVCWAYERGHDHIVTLVTQHQSRPAPLSPSALVAPSMDDNSFTGGASGGSSSDTGYFPLPSPRGKLRAITHEKLDVLHLRTVLPPDLHLSLAQIEHLENIGSGSFGKVFKGRYGDMMVAVKRYRTNVSYGKSDVEMFCREVSILGSLDSPYIVKFIGACLEDPSQFAIVTAYVEGGSLFSNLHEQRRSLDVRSRLNIAIDVARGMLYLHTLPMPIIHRDLNSHNILLTHQLRARVADFGESRFVRNLVEENLTKQPGNLRWMAPEVFTQCTQYSIKADVFSFGLCLWELLTCQLPFAHLKPAAAAADMAYKHSRPPLDPSFPFAVSRLLECAWQKQPDERPDFAEIIEELEHIRDTELEQLEPSKRGGTCESSSSASTTSPTLRHLHHPHHHHPRPTSHHLHRLPCCGSPSPVHTNGSSSVSSSVPETNILLPASNDNELTGHVSALRSRWEQEASRGQSAFKSSHPCPDELSPQPSLTAFESASGTPERGSQQPAGGMDAAPTLMHDLRSRVNPNGYVEGSTYQYRVSGASATNV